MGFTPSMWPRHAEAGQGIYRPSCGQYSQMIDSSRRSLRVLTGHERVFPLLREILPLVYLVNELIAFLRPDVYVPRFVHDVAPSLVRSVLLMLP